MLKVTSFQTKEVSGFNRDGSVYKAEELTFYVGDHGPFHRLFPAQRDNTADIQQYMATKVAQLNRLVQANV